MSESKGPLIAVDMDDVLAMTNENLVEWHNRHHGSDMTLEDCHYFHYWKNPHWGTPEGEYHGTTHAYEFLIGFAKRKPRDAEQAEGLPPLGRLPELEAGAVRG
ncbi:hypothetical protein M407DRAFT_20369 [Tulasnella calospora MUT 4182]|uniref:Uncharacterized protein n=1 Tax=Tulasnella calospora MUT 4182 TaxID=1051891 RepID=A0A0C3QRY5_9AGAM|nr:hypothetical protein M407DRAFT_20369 [Tulasnella calospora MUT 4182]